MNTAGWAVHGSGHLRLLLWLTKVATHYTVPGGAVLAVKILLDVGRHILLYCELFQRLHGGRARAAVGGRRRGEAGIVAWGGNEPEGRTAPADDLITLRSTRARPVCFSDGS